MQIFQSLKMLSNAYFLTKFRFDTAENEPCKVCRTRIGSDVAELREVAEVVALHFMQEPAESRVESDRLHLRWQRSWQATIFKTKRCQFLAVCALGPSSHICDRIPQIFGKFDSLSNIPKTAIVISVHQNLWDCEKF